MKSAIASYIYAEAKSRDYINVEIAMRGSCNINRGAESLKCGDLCCSRVFMCRSHFVVVILIWWYFPWANISQSKRPDANYRLTYAMLASFRHRRAQSKCLRHQRASGHGPRDSYRRAIGEIHRRHRHWAFEVGAWNYSIHFIDAARMSKLTNRRHDIMPKLRPLTAWSMEWNDDFIMV